MIQQLFTKIKAPQLSPNLGKGSYVLKALPADTIQKLPEQKPAKINRWTCVSSPINSTFYK